MHLQKTMKPTLKTLLRHDSSEIKANVHAKQLAAASYHYEMEATFSRCFRNKWDANNKILP